MRDRPDKTAADYVTIALSPLLIMLMVGSLLYFLVEVFYQGEYKGRLLWVLACFDFATVMIARLSITEGAERAGMFGAALAIATATAINRLVTGLAWPINLSLLALAWWCNHRLTWDCTLIDDTEDASGEGLLQVAGLDTAPGAPSRAARAA